jgi:predicted membrane-bound mannosyltransferase
MAEADRIPDDAWRLDDESIERAEHQPRLTPPTTAIAVNLSHERLARAVYVVTAEHLGWYVVAAYALVTRVMALGARPLDPAQATGALAASVIAAHGRAAFALADASWVAMLQGWIFAAAGATDANSRIVAILCGLILVAIGFAMRPVLGRAGGLAFAALIAISPSVTYFSRGGAAVIVSIAFMMIAIAIAESMRRRPGVLRAAGLGFAIALWLSADTVGYVTAAATVASLLVVGAADAMRIDHRRLRIRVWWNRRRLLVIVCAIVAIVLWISLTTAFFHRPLAPAVEYYFSAAFAPPSIAFEHAIHRLIPILAFYEFTIVILAIVGASAVVARRIGDRFAAWSVVWAVAMLAALAGLGANHSDAVVAVVLPLAVVAACAVERMHQSERWNSIRYALAAAVALSLYVQIVVNFVHSAPDVSEAAWRRHALLFWAEPATSIQTVRECERVRNAIYPAGSSAMIPDDALAVQWYLRDFAPTDSPDAANIVVTVGKTQRGALAGNPDASQFGFEEWWTPDFRMLTIAGALKYFFTQRVWSDVEIQDLQIVVSKPGGAAKEPNP